MAVKRKLYWYTKLFTEYIRMNFLTAMEYRASFLIQVFGMVLNDVALLFFWWVLFQKVNIIKGWDIKDVFTIYAIVASGFGLATGIFGNITRLPLMINRGELDHYLTLPKSPLFNILISKMSFSAWGDVLFGIAVFIFLVHGSFLNLLLFILVSIISGLIFVSFLVMLSSLTFFFESGEQLAEELTEAVISFSLYPSSIFPQEIKIILFTFIPAALIGYLPAIIVKSFSLRSFLLLLLFLAVFMVLGITFFYRGMHRYASGSVYGPKI